MSDKDVLMWLKILFKHLALNEPIHISNSEQIEKALRIAIQTLEQPKMDNQALIDKLKQLEPFNNADVPEWVIGVIERWQ